jgi:hypothetical protein
MAIMPMHLEQFLIGRRLAEARVAKMTAPEVDLPDLATWLSQAVGDASLNAAASARAAEHARYRFDEGAARTAQRLARDLR